MRQQILIMTDSSEICHTIQYCWGGQSTPAECVTSISGALKQIMEHEYHLIIADLQLPGMDKEELIKILRVAGQIPVLAITAPLEANEKITLFRAGMDAYIEKPINAAICKAQADALIRLYLSSDDDSNRHTTLTFGAFLVISLCCRQVFISGEPIELTKKEFDLLYYFAKHPYQVFSTEQLFRQIWDNSYGLGCDDTVKVHINTLRKKLSSLEKKIIETIRGVGYRFIPPDSTG